MLGPWIILRLVAGGILVLTGLVGLVIPVMPGILFIALGLSIGITWHPRGLALWRRLKAGLYRLLIRLCGRRKLRPEADVKG